MQLNLGLLLSETGQYELARTYFNKALEYASNNITQTLGIDTAEFATLNIYPNPTSHKVNISAPVTIDRVSVYNVLGQHLQTKTPSSTDTEIDLSALSPGTYLLKAVSGDRTRTRKIIKKSRKSRDFFIGIL